MLTHDGKFILEKLGSYNPLTVPASIQIDRQKALDWLQKVLNHRYCSPHPFFQRVLYHKHLLRGVSLGLFDEATAMEKIHQMEPGTWCTHIAKRQGCSQKNAQDRRDAPVVKKVAEKAQDAPVAEEAPAAEETKTER